MDKHTPRIVVVDDDSFILSCCRMILKDYAGLRLYDCAQKALDEFGEDADSPDIILLDLNMPGLDGIQFVSALEEKQFLGSVILLSGADERIMDTSKAIAERHGITVLGALGKPLAAQSLLSLISQWQPAGLLEKRRDARLYPSDEIADAIYSGQLFNMYQPKVNLSTGDLYGYEALVRWHHPVDGIVNPAQFMPVVEDSDLIALLTERVIQNALDDADLWQSVPGNPTMAINLSMRNLVERDFPGRIERLVCKHQLAPENLTLEITESAIVEQNGLAIDALARLRLKGFNVSIDDFGTGYSSMEKLRDVAFSELKIDRGFVAQAHGDAAKDAIFQTSLQLARRFSMQAVAEGIEDEQDWQYVKKAGCDLGQGYFISRPLCAPDIRGWQSDWIKKTRQDIGMAV